MRLVTSQLASPVRAPLVVPRGTAEAAEQRRAQAPILWPRYDPATRSTRFVRIPADQVPAGWQSVQFHVPMRLASCEETDCPMFLRGWTEVARGVTAVTDETGRVTGVVPNTVGVRAGVLEQDEAVALYGLDGPRELPPEVIHHPAGTPCPRIHKVPSGVPPLYTVNGRHVLWNEFEDSLGGGIHQAAKLRQEGRS